MAYRIGAAQPADVAKLGAIEQAAAALFRDWDVPASVLAEATPDAEFREAQEAGRLWVARDAAGEPIGFALVELVDGRAHLAEMDVHPAHGRRGAGRALLDAVAAWARAQGHEAVTLTTFRDVPWNAPFYRSAGFRELEAGEIPPELAAVLRDEARRGLAPARRVAMLRAL